MPHKHQSTQVKPAYLPRRKRGSYMVDTGPALWLLLLGLTFPLLNLATIGLRYTFLLAASRQAAQDASVSKTFFANPTGGLSCTNMASQSAAAACSKFKGITLTTVQTNIVTTNLLTNAVTRQSVPLATAADTTNNLYEIEVVLTGQVSPLVTYRGAFFGNIPGMTGPSTYRLPSQQICEYPQGLNQ